MKITTMMYLEAHRGYFPLYMCVFSLVVGDFGFFGSADSDSGQYTRCAICLMNVSISNI